MTVFLKCLISLEKEVQTVIKGVKMLDEKYLPTIKQKSPILYYFVNFFDLLALAFIYLRIARAVVEGAKMIDEKYLQTIKQRNSILYYFVIFFGLFLLVTATLFLQIALIYFLYFSVNYFCDFFRIR